MHTEFSSDQCFYEFVFVFRLQNYRDELIFVLNLIKFKFKITEEESLNGLVLKHEIPKSCVSQPDHSSPAHHDASKAPRWRKCRVHSWRRPSHPDLRNGRTIHFFIFFVRNIIEKFKNFKCFQKVRGEMKIE